MRSQKKCRPYFSCSSKAVSSSRTFVSVELSNRQVSSAGHQGQNWLRDLTPQLRRDVVIAGLKRELRHCKQGYDNAMAALADLRSTHKGLVEAHRAVVLQLREARVTTRKLSTRIDGSRTPAADCMSEDGVTLSSNADSRQTTPHCHPDLKFHPPLKVQLDLLFMRSQKRPNR